MIIYKNHEIAAHGSFHKNFTSISDAEILEEINSDILALTKITNREIKSMAYPFGNTNEHIAKLLSIRITSYNVCYTKLLRLLM